MSPIVVDRRQQRVRKCPCGCGERGLCAPHRARLAGIRDSLQGAGHKPRGDERGRYGEGDRTRRGPTCTEPGCMNARKAPALFCADCRAAGASEDDVE